MDSLNTKQEYNDDPVYYCSFCLSLNIKTVAGGSMDLDHCDDCGGTDIQTAHIEQWEELYKKRYGIEYLKRDLT